MRRQDKFPETEFFHYFNANPKNRITGDCRIRAISVACEVPYNQVVMDLARVHCETGYDQCVHQGISILLEKYGWKKMKQPRKIDNKKYTGKEFCLNIAESGKRYILNMTHHEVAVVDKKIWDIWDSTVCCVGNYWVKENG